MNSKQVDVAAMEAEPYLTFLASNRYMPESRQAIESDCFTGKVVQSEDNRFRLIAYNSTANHKGASVRKPAYTMRRKQRS